MRRDEFNRNIVAEIHDDHITHDAEDNQGPQDDRVLKKQQQPGNHLSEPCENGVFG